jgi:hypothetical protein
VQFILRKTQAREIIIENIKAQAKESLEYELQEDK